MSDCSTESAMATTVKKEVLSLNSLSTNISIGARRVGDTPNFALKREI